MTASDDPMSEARALADRMSPGEWFATICDDNTWIVNTLGEIICDGLVSIKDEEDAAGIVAAVRAFRAICAPESVEALARVLCADGRYPLEDWRDYEPEARAVLAHLARIAMEGAER